MPDHNLPGQPQRGPFTVANLRTLLRNDVLKGNQVLPSVADLQILASHMNALCETYAVFSKDTKDAKHFADKVRDALSTIQQFFEERREACGCADAPEVDTKTYAAEQALYNHFRSFMEAFTSHSFDLSMDADVIAPNLNGWHSIAGHIASSFKLAMASTTNGAAFGLSNEGPIPRFVAATIPIVTGEMPSIQAVGKWLKDEARKKRGTTD